MPRRSADAFAAGDCETALSRLQRTRQPTCGDGRRRGREAGDLRRGWQSAAHADGLEGGGQPGVAARLVGAGLGGAVACFVAAVVIDMWMEGAAACYGYPSSPSSESRDRIVENVTFWRRFASPSDVRDYWPAAREPFDPNVEPLEGATHLACRAGWASTEPVPPFAACGRTLRACTLGARGRADEWFSFSARPRRPRTRRACRGTRPRGRPHRGSRPGRAPGPGSGWPRQVPAGRPGRTP